MQAETKQAPLASPKRRPPPVVRRRFPPHGHRTSSGTRLQRRWSFRTCNGRC